jgi:hypothetical protein
VISVSVFQIQLMQSRQRGSKTFEMFAVFYRFLCINKRLSSSTVFPDVNAINNAHQEEVLDRNSSSSPWDVNTITSTSSAAVYDYSIKLPSLPQDRLQFEESVVRNHSNAVFRGKRAWTT